MSHHNFFGLISCSLLVFYIFWGVVAMVPIKRHRIDWNSIPIICVPADMENPNPLNPCSRKAPKEREEERVSISAKIWARAMKERINNGSKQKAT